MDEQIGDLLEFANVRNVEDVVTAVMEIVAGAADRAQRGVAGCDAGQRDRLLGLGTGGGRLNRHRVGHRGYFLIGPRLTLVGLIWPSRTGCRASVRRCDTPGSRRVRRASASSAQPTSASPPCESFHRP